MIALDQEKVFDWIGCNFLFKALQYFGYGPEIIQKIKKSYRSIETQTKVNGHASFSSEERTAARMPVIYDSVHYISRNIFREYKTKQWHQSYCNRRKGTENLCFCRWYNNIHRKQLLPCASRNAANATDINYNKTNCMRIWLGSKKGNSRKLLRFKWNSGIIKNLG